jgi:hypothetical protein
VRRLAALGVAAAVVLSACDGGEEAGAPSPSTPATSAPPGEPSASTTESPSPTPSPEASSTPSPPREVELPPDAPTTLEIDAGPADLPLDRLVPPGAEVHATWILDPPEDPTRLLGVVWSRGEDPLFRERGFAVWMPFEDPPRWEVVYAFTDPEEAGVLGIRTAEGDLTGDNVPDLMTFEDVGGSGGCGTWRVVVSGASVATEVFRRQTCDAELSIVGDHLELLEAVFEPDDAHCCPSAFRTTVLEWDGERFARTGVRESPAPPP